MFFLVTLATIILSVFGFWFGLKAVPFVIFLSSAIALISVIPDLMKKSKIQVFENDGTFAKSLDNKQKGIIVCFYDKLGKYFQVNTGIMNLWIPVF